MYLRRLTLYLFITTVIISYDYLTKTDKYLTKFDCFYIYVNCQNVSEKKM